MSALKVNSRKSLHCLCEFQSLKPPGKKPRIAIRLKPGATRHPKPAAPAPADIPGTFRLLSPSKEVRLVDVPLLGDIPAGYPAERAQDSGSCVSVQLENLVIKPTARTFALEVRGDSMIEKNILPGDVLIFEHGLTPKNGDVVAALIDRESTLKTFLTEKGKPYLKAENPKYPKLIPAEELVIQGVMIALIRRRSR